MDSGIPGPTLEPRRDVGMPTATAMEIPTVPPPAPPPEKHVFEMQVRSNSGESDVAAKTRVVICDPSYTDPSKTKLIGKVVRYTKHSQSTYIPDLLNKVVKSIDSGQIIIAQKTTGTQEQHLRDDGVVGALCHFQGQVHHYREHRRSDRCGLLGIRVPKCT